MFPKRYYHSIRLLVLFWSLSGGLIASGSTAIKVVGEEDIRSNLVLQDEESFTEQAIRSVVNKPVAFLLAVILGAVMVGGLTGMWKGVVGVLIGGILGAMIGGMIAIALMIPPVQRAPEVVVVEAPSIPAGYMATLFDLILLLLLLLFGYRGFRNGFLAQFFSTAATIIFLAAGKRIFSMMMKVSAGLWPGLDEAALPFAAFSLLLVSGFCFVYIAEKLLKRLLAQTFIGYLDSLLGGVLGIVQASFCLSTLILLLDMYEVSLPESYTENMRVYQFIAMLVPNTMATVQSYLPSYVTSCLPHVSLINHD